MIRITFFGCSSSELLNYCNLRSTHLFTIYMLQTLKLRSNSLSVSRSCCPLFTSPRALAEKRGLAAEFTRIRFGCFCASKQDREAAGGKFRLGRFLCDDWTAFGLDQLQWHGLREGRHGVESLTSAMCAFRLVLSYAVHTHTHTHTDAHSWRSEFACASYCNNIYLFKDFSET